MTAFLIWLVCLVEDSPKTVAMLHGATGKVYVSNDPDVKAAKPASRMVKLAVGDRIDVDPKAKVKVGFFDDDHWEELGPGTYRVEKSGCKAVDGKGEVKPLSPSPHLKNAAVKASWKGLSSGRSAGVVVRSVPETDDPPPFVLPIRGEHVLDPKPAFHWPAGPGAASYKLRLVIEGSNRLIFEAKSAKNSLEFPEGQAALKRDRIYRWSVLAVDKDGTETLFVRSSFRVDPEWDASTLKSLDELAASEDPLEVLIAVSAFQSHCLEQRALSASKRLLDLAPEDADVRTLYSANLELAGRRKEAEKVRKEKDADARK